MWFPNVSFVLMWFPNVSFVLMWFPELVFFLSDVISRCFFLFLCDFQNLFPFYPMSIRMCLSIWYDFRNLFPFYLTLFLDVSFHFDMILITSFLYLMWFPNVPFIRCDFWMCLLLWCDFETSSLLSYVISGCVLFWCDFQSRFYFLSDAFPYIYFCSNGFPKSPYLI